MAWWNPLSFGDQLTKAARRTKLPVPKLPGVGTLPAPSLPGAARPMPNLPGLGSLPGAISGALGKGAPRPALPPGLGAVLPGAASAISGAFGRTTPSGTAGMKSKFPVLEAPPLPTDLEVYKAASPDADALAALGAAAGRWARGRRPIGRQRRRRI